MLFLFEKLIYMIFFVVLHVDVHSPSERSVQVSLPGYFSFGRRVLVPETVENAVRYDLNLPQLQHVMQYYNMYVTPKKCEGDVHHATASLIVPWSQDDYHVFVTDTIKTVLPIRLQTSRPKGINDTAKLKLMLDPLCRYELSIEMSLVGVVGQFARFYSVFLLPYVAVVIMMCLRHQLRMIGNSGSCRLIFTSLVGGMRPYFFLTIVKSFSIIMGYGSLKKFLPTPDWTLIANEGMDFFFLPLSLYLVGVGIFWLSSVVLASSLVLCESFVQRLALKLLSRSFTGFVKASDYLLTGLHKLPVFVAVGLLLVTFASCGGLALCLGACFYYLKLTHMSQDYVEELAIRIVKSVANRFRSGDAGPQTSAARTEPTNEVPETTEQPETVENTNEQTAVENPDDTKVESAEESSDTEKSEAVSAAENREETPQVQEERIGDTEVETESDKEETMPTEAEGENRATEIDGQELENTVEGAIFFHFSIFLLWLLVSCMSVPSLLTWAHNFKFSPTLRPDPFFYSGVVLSLCAIPLWQMELPIREKKWYHQLSMVIFAIAFMTLMYSTLSLHRLQYFLTGTILFIVLHQLVAPSKLATVGVVPRVRNAYASRVRVKVD